MQRDVCADYVSLTASLAEETVNCTGTIGPDSFNIDEKGFLRNRFETCSVGTDIERTAALNNVKRLLRFQNFGDRLPKLRECLTDRYTRWKELFARANIKTCPTWTPRVVVGDPSRQGAEAARAAAIQFGRMQPKFNYAPARPKGLDPTVPFYVTGAGQKGQPVSALQGPAGVAPSKDQRYADIRVPAKSVIVYDISYPAAEETCADPAVCAAQCAAFLPGFVIAAAGTQVAADPIQWYRDRMWNQGCTSPTRDDPWCAPDYVHQMSVNSTTGGTVPPGDQYGHPERGKYGEHCLKWLPPAPDRPQGFDYETDLVLECMDPTEADCLSRCGN